MSPILTNEVFLAEAPVRPVLPQTRTLRRRHSAAAVWIGAASIAVVVNTIVIMGLAQMSHPKRPAHVVPLAVHRMREVSVETSPPPPPPVPSEQAATDIRSLAPIQASTPIPLPPLDLPAASSLANLALPMTSNRDEFLNLPLHMPAFATVGIPDAGMPALSSGPAGPALAVDTPAECEAAFDLGRFYPAVASMRRITGWSLVRIAIEADGRVGKIEVMESSPPQVFTQATEHLARSLHFRPAERAGAAVASLVETRIQWTLP